LNPTHLKPVGLSCQSTAKWMFKQRAFSNSVRGSGLHRSHHANWPPDSFRVKVKDDKNILIDSDVAFYTHELAAKSDNDLLELLEDVSALNKNL
jgi:hypothetical protein